MRIGIDASRAFLARRTGIEEYSYQVIRHLREVLSAEDEVVLYVRKKFTLRKWQLSIRGPEIDFDLPANWTVRGIWAPRFWTQIGLSLEMLFHQPDALFVPAHVVPLLHPHKTIVTVHGLEYEFCPEGYSWWERLYMRFSIKFSVRVAHQIIAVSENTRRDIIRLYRIPADKIVVVHEGASQPRMLKGQYPIPHRPYFLFIGRLEARKNIVRIIEAFEIFRDKTKLPYQLVLSGKPGYGYQYIKHRIVHCKYQEDILETGYVSEGEKWELLRQAQIFLFPSLYEGFGLPVLEAQQVGIPVITSTTSSLPEVAGLGALLVDPAGSKKLARAMITLTTDLKRRADIIDKATRNADRFSWARCAREVAQLLKNSSSA